MEKKVLEEERRLGDIRVHVHHFESLFEMLFLLNVKVQLESDGYRSYACRPHEHTHTSTNRHIADYDTSSSGLPR